MLSFPEAKLTSLPWGEARHWRKAAGAQSQSKGEDTVSNQDTASGSRSGSGSGSAGRNRGGGRWCSIDFVLEHARRDIREGSESTLNPYLLEFASSPWADELRSERFRNLMSSKKTKKEILEAYAAINLVRRTFRRIQQKRGRIESQDSSSGSQPGLGSPLSGAGLGAVGGDVKENLFTCVERGDDSLSFDGSGMLVIDLCSGKGFTATIMSYVFPKAKIIMVDKDEKMRLLHLKGLSNVKFRYDNIHSQEFSSWVDETVRSHHKAVGETQNGTGIVRPIVVVVAIHLCGTLSDVAIRMFNRNEGIESLILSPCCMPKKSPLTLLSKKINRSAYELWCWTLYNSVDRNNAHADMFRDPYLRSRRKSGDAHKKNIFIWANRRCTASSTSSSLVSSSSSSASSVAAAAAVAKAQRCGPSVEEIEKQDTFCRPIIE